MSAYWHSMDFDSEGTLSTKISSSSTAPPERRYVDPWDLENYAYMKQRYDSRSPSAAGEPLDASFYYTPCDKEYELYKTSFPAEEDGMATTEYEEEEDDEEEVYQDNRTALPTNYYHQPYSDGDVYGLTPDYSGQAIPKGLHVRINLETGLKEAKLLDKSEDNKKSSALSEVKQPVEEPREETGYSPDELKHILQNIKSDDIISVPTDETQGILEKFRSYEQLKVELGDVNMSVKSDIEILRELFVKFKQTRANTTLLHEDKDTQIVYILEDFEYLVHQIDNANEFVSLDGFNEVIYPNLNSTNVRVKCESLSVLAACVQNNGKTQIHALESGAVDKVIKILALDANINVKLRAVYALSSLLRRFPLAQTYFIKNGGLNVFTTVFAKSDNIKLQVKIVTLVYDLLMEHQDAVNDAERLRQYRAVDLKAKLIELGWCNTFNGLLVTSVLVEANDHDTVERCLHVMTLVSDGCLDTFNNDRLRTVLGELYHNYTQLSIAEGTADSYYNSLKELTHSLLKHINSYRKTEL